MLSNLIQGKLLQGRYQVVQVLSKGGFCHTYLALDTCQAGSPTYVIKHLQPLSNYPNSLPTLRNLFTREAQALQKLGNYDRVPTLVAHFEEDREFYLVQEFILGHTLSLELQSGYRWREQHVVELLKEVLGILEVVHSHGLIHRDLKPSNLVRRQQDGRLVLIDFGSVKQAWTQLITTQEKPGERLDIGIPSTLVIGTPGYMPTEQGRGRPRPNSDIYALGMMAIQALTGLHPAQLLEDSDSGEFIWQHQAVVSPGLAFVLNKMVHYHFQDRYQTATSVLQALQPKSNLYKVEPRTAAPRRENDEEQNLLSAFSKQPSTQKEAPSPVTSTPMPQAPTTGQENNLVGSKQHWASNSGSHASDAAVPHPSRKIALLLGMEIGFVTAAALVVGFCYFLQPPALKFQQNLVLVPNKNTAIGNIALAKTLTGHSNMVWSVALSPDHQTLVSGSGDKTIKLWNLRTGELLRTLSGNAAMVLSVAVSRDGQTVASSSYATEQAIKLGNLGTSEPLRTLSQSANQAWSIAFSPDGQTLVSSSGDKTIKLWNLRTGELRRTLVGHSDLVWSVAISPDGQTLASGSRDKTIKLWNLRNGQLYRTLTGHSDRVRSVALSLDGQILASGSWDKTIKLWNLRTGKLLRTLVGHSAYVNAVAISPSGQILASGSDDYTIKLWNLRTGELLRTLTGHSGNVNSLAFDTEGKILVSGSGDKTIKIWRLGS